MKPNFEYMVRLGGPDDKVEFEIGETFFAGLDNSDWDGGEINASVNSFKESGVITLEIILKGKLNIMCDRCLEYYAQEIETTHKLFVKYGEADEEIDETVILVSRDEHQVDISSYIEEFLILALPLKKVHPDNVDGTSACNEVMIDKLEQHLVKGVEETTDPRWDELKKLKDLK